MDAPTSRLSDKAACLADSARTFCQSTVGVEAGGSELGTIDPVNATALGRTNPRGTEEPTSG
jgi:hypothetical protein